MIVNLKSYSMVNNSGVEWLGEIPVHWKVLKLKHWLTMNRQTLSEETDPDYTFDYLDISSVGTGLLVTMPERIRFRDCPSRARRVVQSGDTIMSTVRTYLKAVWHASEVKSNLVASTGFVVLTPKPSTHAKFVSYLCLSEHFTNQVTASSIGIAYPAIAEIKLKAIKVGVPPLSEQTAIARFLDHATNQIERYIRAKEKLIALLEEQKQVMIHDAVTGRIDVRTGKPYPAYKPSGAKWLGDVPTHWQVNRNGRLFVQRNEVGYSELPILEVSLISGVRVRDFDNSSRKQVMSDRSLYKRAVEGDIAYNMMRMWQGAVGVAPVDGLVSPAYVVARPLAGNETRYYEHLFRTSAYKNEVDKYSRGIVKDRNRLYWEDFKQMPSPCPPPNEQVLIANAISQTIEFTSTNIQNARSQIALADEYHTRLIADVVTGKLDVREAAKSLPDVDLSSSNDEADVTQAESNAPSA